MLSVAVLCGGKGTRIAAVAGDLPKALVPVLGIPFVQHQLAWLRAAGLTDIVLLTGFRGEQIEAVIGDGSAFGVRVRYRHDGETLRGTGGAVQRALPLLGDCFLAIYGDSLLQADPAAVGAAIEPEDDGVMAVFRNDDRLLPSNVVLDGTRVTSYNKQARPGTMTHIDYGINAFRARAFEGVPDDRPVDLGEVHQRMIDRRALRAFPVTERWYEIGSPEGLAETTAFLRERTGSGGSR
jgi:NDP-sugar pyrophosphorylase family protein